MLRFTPTWPPANEREGNGWTKQGQRDPDPERRWKRISMIWKIKYHNVNLIQNQLMKEMNCDSHLPGPTATKEGMMEDGGWRGRQWMNKGWRNPDPERRWKRIWMKWKIRYHNVNLIQNQLMKEMNCDSHLPGPTARGECRMEGRMTRWRMPHEKNNDDDSMKQSFSEKLFLSSELR